MNQLIPLNVYINITLFICYQLFLQCSFAENTPLLQWFNFVVFCNRNPYLYYWGQRCSISFCAKPSMFSILLQRIIFQKNLFLHYYCHLENLNNTPLLFWAISLLSISSIEVSYSFLTPLLDDFLVICIEHTVFWIPSTYIYSSVVLSQTY